MTCWGYVEWGEPPTGVFDDVAVSAQIACAVRADDTVVCWGLRLEEPVEAPISTATWVDVDAGASGTFCARDVDGWVECWDARPASTAFLTSSPDPVTLLRVGRRAACGARERSDSPEGLTVDCFLRGNGWGAPRFWVKDFDFGGGTECSLLVERNGMPAGELFCSSSSTTPTGVFSQLSISEQLACVADETSVICWGNRYPDPVRWEVAP